MDFGRPGSPNPDHRASLRRRDGRGRLVGEDDGLDAAADAELEEDALDVRLDGGLADVEPLGQLGVVLPARLLAGDGPAKV